MPNTPLTKNDEFYNKYQKYANKLIQFGGEYSYFIGNIKNINDDILKKLDESQSDCWKITEMNSSLSRKENNYDVMYMIENDKIIFSTYINVYKKHNYIYLNSVCASNEYRGKGLFKKALDYIKDHYKKLGFASIKLNVDNTDDNGLNQKKRIEIFNKVGFEIDPILDYYDHKNNYIQTKTKVKLDNGKIVEYNKDIENQVEKCYYDLTEYPCPMILELKYETKS
jgi:ribosomal protein S18 acetylase RimI-like enzyme